MTSANGERAAESKNHEGDLMAVCRRLDAGPCTHYKARKIDEHCATATADRRSDMLSPSTLSQIRGKMVRIWILKAFP
jgi:hypothetical protein